MTTNNEIYADSVPSSDDLTADQRDILKMYTEETYCITLRRSEARENLLNRRLIEWVPAPGWAGSTNYAITELGRAAIARATGAA